MIADLNAYRCITLIPGRWSGQEGTALPPPTCTTSGGTAGRGRKEHTGISEARDSGTAREALIREAITGSDGASDRKSLSLEGIKMSAMLGGFFQARSRGRVLPSNY